MIHCSMITGAHLGRSDGLVQLAISQGNFASLSGLPIHRLQIVFETNSWKNRRRLDVLASPEI